MSNYKDKEEFEVVDLDENENVDKSNAETKNEEQLNEVKNLKVRKNLKRVLVGAAVVLVVGGCIVGKMYYDTKPADIDMTTTDVVSLISEESTIDEVCEVLDLEACSDMDDLKEKVELSEKLHGLDLDKYVEGLDAYEIPESYTVDEVEDLIETFEDYLKYEKVQNGVLSIEDREATKLALNLKSYETLVNKDIDKNAYAILTNSLIALVKAKTLDACSFDASEISNITISNEDNNCSIIFDDNETGKQYEVMVNNNNILTNAGYINKVVDCIRDYQDKASDVSTNDGTYDAERNQSILEGVNMFNTLALMDCEITNNGELKVINNMSDVKEKVKTLTYSVTSPE